MAKNKARSSDGLPAEFYLAFWDVLGSDLVKVLKSSFVRGFLDDAAMTAVFDVYTRFEKGSGSKLNLDKCIGLWAGSWRARSDALVSIVWSSSCIKVLGVLIGNEPMDARNWRPLLEAVSNFLKSWSSCKLSDWGRALASNALALSRIWYVLPWCICPIRFAMSWTLSYSNYFGKARKISCPGRSLSIRERPGDSELRPSFTNRRLSSFNGSNGFFLFSNSWVTLKIF